MKQVELREGARRQHRVVALLGVIQCWTRGLDGIVFQRHHVERLVGIQRFRGTRVDWLKADLQEFFPHMKTLVFSGKDSFASIFASRKPFDMTWPEGKMSDSERVKKFKLGTPKFGIFELWERPHAWNTDHLKKGFGGIIPLFDISSNYDERLAAAYLGLLATGQIAPAELIKAVTSK